MSEFKEREGTPILEAKNVCKYFGGLKAVENVDMKIMKGDVFGIIGPNGAGKTTFFNVCSGIYPPTSGQVIFNGEDISHFKPEQISRKRMTRTFQNIQLFKFMTVLENVKIGCHINTKTNLFDAVLRDKTYKNDEKYTAEKSMEVLRSIGLEDYAQMKAGNLPYGLQRKVEIARALAVEPEILLLDEPAAGMNPNETMELRDFILELNSKGHTIAVIEHDMRFIMSSCNYILVLNFGQKIFEGNPEEVKANQEVQEAYFGKGLIAGGGTIC